MSLNGTPVSLPMGQIAVCSREGLLRTLLGSCVGIALYDRQLKIGALAHVVLPDSKGKTDVPGKFADTAVPEMLRQMERLAEGRPVKPLAKLAGGANMFASVGGQMTIGLQNVEAIERLLSETRITIVARDLGGTQGRRMTLDVSSGVVTIEIADQTARRL